MIVCIAYVVCDLCRAKGPKGKDELEAHAACDRKRWRVIALGYGNELHFCPQCAAGKTNAELAGKVGLDL